jgi:mono/diheme cytochrome c family protein
LSANLKEARWIRKRKVRKIYFDGGQLNDPQVAVVLTYIRNSWGNASRAVSPDEVARLRASLAKRSD